MRVWEANFLRRNGDDQAPEMLLVVLALVVLAGRYTGYRLTELHRFKALRGA